MKANAMALVSLAAAGCGTVQEGRMKYRCEAVVQRIVSQEQGERPSLYRVEFRVDRVDPDGVRVEEVARPSATVVEDQPCRMVIGEADSTSGSVSEECEVGILVPRESVSREASLQFKVTKANQTLWEEDRKVPVTGRASLPK